MFNNEIPEFYLKNEIEKLKNKWKIVEFLENEGMQKSRPSSETDKDDIRISTLKEILKEK